MANLKKKIKVKDERGVVLKEIEINPEQEVVTAPPKMVFVDQHNVDKVCPPTIASPNTFKDTSSANKKKRHAKRDAKGRFIKQTTIGEVVDNTILVNHLKKKLDKTCDAELPTLADRLNINVIVGSEESVRPSMKQEVLQSVNNYIEKKKECECLQSTQACPTNQSSLSEQKSWNEDQTARSQENLLSKCLKSTRLKVTHWMSVTKNWLDSF